MNVHSVTFALLKRLKEKEIKKAQEEENKFETCKNCGESLLLCNSDSYVCQKCGYVKSVMICTDNCFENIAGSRLISDGSRRFNNIVGDKTRDRHTYFKCIKAVTNQGINQPPDDIISRVVDDLCDLKNHSITLRGSRLTIFIWMRIDYYSNIIYKTRFNILNNLSNSTKKGSGINKKDIARERQYIINLQRSGILKDDVVANNALSFIEPSLRILEIDQKYVMFGIDILDMMNKMRIKGKNGNVLNTKCIAIIYLLTILLKKNITLNDLKNKLKISSETFKSFTYLIISISILDEFEEIYKKYELPLPDFTKYKFINLVNT